MNRAIRKLLLSAAFCAAPVLCTSVLAATPQGTSFNYQGRLTDGGAPASGTYDIQALLFDTAAGGSQVGATVTLNDVSVVNGVFTAELDFGSQFNSDARWLELRVRPGASVGAYSPIAPRTAIDSTPYALGLRLPLTQSMNLGSGLLTFTNASVSNSSYVMKLISGAPSGNSQGTYDPVLVADSNNGNGVVALTSQPAAMSVYAVHSNTGNAVTAVNSGTGSAGTFDVTNAASGANALDVGTVGTGRAAYFTSTKTTATLPTIGATNAATGDSSLASNTENGVAIKGAATGGFSVGVMGTGVQAGVFGYCGTTGGAGVYGRTGGGGGDISSGVRGDGNGAGTSGIAAFNNFGNGIYAQAQGAGSKAGFFSGDVQITGNLSKGSGSFQIDHPLDPANKYLYHSFVEAPNMMNMYDGIVKLDAKGEATVQLPGYFEALNIDYRYQLTCVGASAPVYVSEEVSHNQFKIAGGKPGMKVSWLVTGTRNDPYAQYHRIVPEVEKKAEDKGLYLHPADYGQPVTKQLGIPAALHEEAVKQMEAASGKN